MVVVQVVMLSQEQALQYHELFHKEVAVSEQFSVGFGDTSQPNCECRGRLA